MMGRWFGRLETMRWILDPKNLPTGGHLLVLGGRVLYLTGKEEQ